MAADRTLSGVGLVLTGILTVQVGAAAAVAMFPSAGPGGAVWLRLVISALVMGLLWPPSRLPAPWSPGWRAGLGWSRSAWQAVVGYGVVMSLMNWCFYEAIARVPLGVAVAVEFAGPLTLSVVLSRRALDVVWAIAAAAGLSTLALAGGHAEAADLVGIAFAAVAGGLWAAYILLAQRVGRLVPGTRGLAVALLIGAVVTTPAGLAARVPLDPRVLGLGLAVALLSTAIPYGLELEALRRLPARVFGVLMSLEPAVAALVGLVALGQLLAAPEWVGVVTVCLASLGVTLTARRRPDPA